MRFISLKVKKKYVLIADCETIHPSTIYANGVVSVPNAIPKNMKN